MAVVYKTSPLTYRMAKWLVRIPHIGIANLIADRRICPELIQADASPARLAAALEPLLDDGAARTDMLKGFDEVRTALGAGNAAERAAAIIVGELRSPRPALQPTSR